MFSNRVFAIPLAASLALIGCGPSSPQGDGGADGGSTLFGRYAVTSDVASTTALVREIGELRALAEMHSFPAIDARLQPTSDVGVLLTRMDRRFNGADGAAGAAGLERRLRDGIAAGRATMDALVSSVAEEATDKSLLVTLALAMIDEIQQATADVRAANWASAASHWDRAAVWFTGLEPKFRSRSTTSIPNVWGPGTSALSNENLADRTIALLVDGRGALTAQSRGAAIEIAERTRWYLSKYFFLASVAYGNIVETAAAGTNTDVARMEGGTFFEGVTLPIIDGSAATTAVTSSRARWNGGTMPGAVTRLSVVRDAAQLHVDALGGPVSAYAGTSIDDETRAVLRARLDTTLAIFADPLTLAGRDPVALRARIASAAAQSQAGDHAGAAAALVDVLDGLRAVATVGAMR